MRDPLKVLWYRIKERCYNENSKSYHRYGGRGICVCEEWLNDSSAFARWAIENGYEKGLEIDRIDNDKGYSPENCRWVTKKENTRNTRRNKRYEWNGETHVLSEWCEILELNYNTVNMRLHRGWSFEKAVTKPTKTTYLIISFISRYIFPLFHNNLRYYRIDYLARDCLYNRTRIIKSFPV